MVLQRTEKNERKKEVPEFNFSRPISIQNVVKFWVAIGLIGVELQGIRSVKKKVKSRQCDIKEQRESFQCDIRPPGHQMISKNKVSVVTSGGGRCSPFERRLLCPWSVALWGCHVQGHHLHPCGHHLLQYYHKNLVSVKTKNFVRRFLRTMKLMNWLIKAGNLAAGWFSIQICTLTKLIYVVLEQILGMLSKYLNGTNEPLYWLTCLANRGCSFMTKICWKWFTDCWGFNHKSKYKYKYK